MTALLTDLYQLTMLKAGFEHGLNDTAVFDFFVRRLPPNRGFLVAAGLEQALGYLAELAFAPDELAWLASTGRFDRRFLRFLATFRFTGDVDAMPEGTPFFASEPILRVTAPMAEAQFVESRLINLLHFQTVIASKAARMVLAAPGKQLVDFGMRRAHGAEAALLAARAAYIAGFAGTATIASSRAFGIPMFGTMAHSFIQAHDSEEAAFLAFAQSAPNNVVLLLDTHDTERAAETVANLAPTLGAEGIHLRGVRLDSGDLAVLAGRVRRILDKAGLAQVRILASGGIDEKQLMRFVGRGAPIDGYGIGTALTTSEDAPALDCAYKLEEYAGRPRRKRSPGKGTLPGRKQVFRRFNGDGSLAGDVIGLDGETVAGQPLLLPVMRGGHRLASPGLEAIRSYAGAQLALLPHSLRALDDDAAGSYRVEVSEGLRMLVERMDRDGG